MNKLRFEKYYNDFPDPWGFEMNCLGGWHRVYSSIKYVPPGIYDRILDIGCGEGYSTNLLSKKSNCVVGMDISPTAIKRAKAKYKQIEFLVADIEKLPFRSDTFDLITCIDVIEYYAKSPIKYDVINNLRKLLTAGGGILFVAPICSEEYFETYDEFVDMIAKNLKILKVVPVTSKLTMPINRRLMFLPKSLNIQGFPSR